MNFPLSRRLGFFAIFVACAAMMAFALYLQYYRWLNPCPMCIFQRVFVIATGTVALVAALHNPISRMGARAYGWVVALMSLAGLGIAARHTYIQYFPLDTTPSCGAGLMTMLHNMPFLRVVGTVLYGTGECSQIDWSMLGLSLPGWAMVGFAALAGIALWVGMTGRGPR